MRVSIRLNGSAEHLMERLASKLNIKPREAILDALALFNLTVEQMEASAGQLGIRDKDGNFTAIATPTLVALQRRGEIALAKQIQEEQKKEKREEIKASLAAKGQAEIDAAKYEKKTAEPV